MTVVKTVAEKFFDAKEVYNKIRNTFKSNLELFLEQNFNEKVHATLNDFPKITFEVKTKFKVTFSYNKKTFEVFQYDIEYDNFPSCDVCQENINTLKDFIKFVDIVQFFFKNESVEQIQEIYAYYNIYQQQLYILDRLNERLYNLKTPKNIEYFWKGELKTGVLLSKDKKDRSTTIREKNNLGNDTMKYSVYSPNFIFHQVIENN